MGILEGNKQMRKLAGKEKNRGGIQQIGKKVDAEKSSMIEVGTLMKGAGLITILLFFKYIFEIV